MTELAPEPARTYDLRRLPVDPWGRTLGLVCSTCRAYIEDGGEAQHNADHDTPNAELSASQLHVIAANMRARTPPPTPDQTLGEYSANLAVHELTHAIDLLAETLEPVDPEPPTP